MMSATYENPYTLFMPRAEAMPVLLSIPHSGTHYLQAFLDRSSLDEMQIRQSEDSFIDMFFAMAAHYGAHVLIANYPRAFVDLNRAENELDPYLIKQKLKKSDINFSTRTAAGLGVIPRVVAENTPIYPDKIDLKEAQKRLTHIYRPFHNALQQTITHIKQKFGYVILLDMHSMPSHLLDDIATHHNEPMIDITIGDKYGRACATHVSVAIASYFRDRNYHVSLNQPYSGGFITTHYGKPTKAQHAVQIEINRKLYMDEKKFMPHEGFETLRAHLHGLVSYIARSSISYDLFKAG